MRWNQSTISALQWLQNFTAAEINNKLIDESLLKH